MAADGTTTRAVEREVPARRPSGSLDALQQLVDLGTRVHHEVARRAGLSTSELYALRHLSGGAMGPVELARALGVTSAASSGVVDRLVARGHVTRRPHALDGRRTEVLITESGSREVVGLLAPMFAELMALDTALTPEQAEVVERYLRGAVRALRTVL